MKYDLTQARKCIETLDKRRFDRALLGSGDAFRHIVSLVPLLLHLNHPALPGYVEDAPAKALPILSFQLSAKFFSQRTSRTCRNMCKVRSILMLFSHRS